MQGDEHEHFIEVLLAEDVGQSVKECYVTFYERILEEGRSKGLLQGREEGRKTGREEGQRALLLRLFTLKFGPCSSEVVRRVQTATADDLDRWAERVLAACTLEDALD